MNARTIRRAIERKAQKQARKEEARDMAVLARQNIEQLGLDSATAPRSVSVAQLDANRRNSRLSTGPVTPEGKLRSSSNALKTGLTGRAVLLANEDAALYEHHVQSFFAELKPVGDRETDLVQSIADSKWRLARIPGLEFGIYALGRIQFADEFQNVREHEAAALIEAKTFLTFQRQLNNLSIQESRLRRQCEKDIAELSRLQELRASAERADSRLSSAGRPTSPQPRLESSLGFEFASGVVHSEESGSPLDRDPLAIPQAA